MGGKETSDRVRTASARSSRYGAPTPISLAKRLTMEPVPQSRSTYLYAFGFIFAVAFTVYVFVLSY
jgi:hypothetical protein